MIAKDGLTFLKGGLNGTKFMPIRSSRCRRVLQFAHAIRAVMISGILGGNLASLLLIGNLRKTTVSIQYNLFGWRMISGKGLPIAQFHELFDSPQHVSVELLPAMSYLTYWDANYAKDVIYLALVAKALSPRIVFEIGTLKGYTALLFALNTPMDCLIYTLDLPRHGGAIPSLSTTLADDLHISRRAQGGYLYQSHPVGKKVTQLFGDSARFEFTPWTGKVDLFFHRWVTQLRIRKVGHFESSLLRSARWSDSLA